MWNRRRMLNTVIFYISFQFQQRPMASSWSLLHSLSAARCSLLEKLKLLFVRSFFFVRGVMNSQSRAMYTDLLSSFFPIFFPPQFSFSVSFPKKKTQHHRRYKREIRNETRATAAAVDIDNIRYCGVHAGLGERWFHFGILKFNFRLDLFPFDDARRYLECKQIENDGGELDKRSLDSMKVCKTIQWGTWLDNDAGRMRFTFELYLIFFLLFYLEYHATRRINWSTFSSVPLDNDIPFDMNLFKNSQDVSSSFSFPKKKKSWSFVVYFVVDAKSHVWKVNEHLILFFLGSFAASTTSLLPFVMCYVYAIVLFCSVRFSFDRLWFSSHSSFYLRVNVVALQVPILALCWRYRRVDRQVSVRTIAKN